MHFFVPNGGGNMVLSIINKKDATCFGAHDGSATINITGGTPGFTYAWNPNISSSATSNILATGTYTITVTDTNNCSSQIQTIINQPNLLIGSHQSKPTLCGKNNGDATLNISGGTKPYTYLWTGGGTSQTMANLSTGTYYVLIKDANSCSMMDTIFIQNSVPLVVSLSAIADSCSKSTGKLLSQIISGTNPFQYKWSNGSTNSFIQNLAANHPYSVFVLDSNLCTDTVKANIAALGNFSFNLGADTVFCSSQNQIVLSLPNYVNFLWQDGSTENKFIIQSAGEYFVRVENTYGCFASDTINVTEHCIDIMQAPNAFSPNDDGIDDEFGPITNSPSALYFYTIYIFNRWGEQVFFSDEYEHRWNGKYNSALQPVGTYVYLIEYNFDKNTPNTKLKGDLILVK
jgi:gliding motility-associated-like protein